MSDRPVTAITAQCEGTRHRVNGEAYRCPLRLRTPGQTLCGRCEMAVEVYGEDMRWADDQNGS